MSTPRKLRVLDLCCKAGGAGAGYAKAGFEVHGWDIEPQPRYPFAFCRGDALNVLKFPRYVQTFDLVHISPPCQGFKSGTLWADKPDVLTPARELLDGLNVPWVIENVMDAPLIKENSVVLCADNFGLRSIRHRRFEFPAWLRPRIIQPEHAPHRATTAHRGRRAHWDAGGHASFTGDIGTYAGPEGLGIDWMTGNELSEAIPPVFTYYIGGLVANYLRITERKS